VSASSAPAAGSWSLVAVTVSGTTVTHYLNGLTNGLGTITSFTPSDGGKDAKIGSRDDLATMFKGSMDGADIERGSFAGLDRHEYNNGHAPLTFASVWA
jgi:hypothetical protein